MSPGVPSHHGEHPRHHPMHDGNIYGTRKSTCPNTWGSTREIIQDPMFSSPVSLGLRHNLVLSEWTDTQAFGKQASFSVYYEVLEPASGLHESIRAET